MMCSDAFSCYVLLDGTTNKTMQTPTNNNNDANNSNNNNTNVHENKAKQQQ